MKSKPYLLVTYAEEISTGYNFKVRFLRKVGSIFKKKTAKNTRRQEMCLYIEGGERRVKKRFNTMIKASCANQTSGHRDPEEEHPPCPPASTVSEAQLGREPGLIPHRPESNSWQKVLFNIKVF